MIKFLHKVICIDRDMILAKFKITFMTTNQEINSRFFHYHVQSHEITPKVDNHTIYKDLEWNMKNSTDKKPNNSISIIKVLMT
jgi:hypothetical protein